MTSSLSPSPQSMSKITDFFFLLTLFTVFPFLCVHAELEDVIKTCFDVNCDAVSGDPVVHPEHNYQLMSAGVPQIFWNDVRKASFVNGSSSPVLSPGCRSQLLTIANAISNDESWPYEFIDAAGKTPAGLFRSTTTAIGDYDQCLTISQPDHGIDGKYCMVDMFAVNDPRRTEGKVALAKASVFRGYPFWNALCVPSACSDTEIQSQLQQLMRPYGIRVTGDISCDTAHDVSIVTRIMNLTKGQVISLVFVAVVVSTVLAATAHQVVNFVLENMTDKLPDFVNRIPKVSQTQFSQSLSLFESTKKLLYSKENEYEVLIFDLVKLFVIWTGTLAHLLVCVESPLSTATMDKHDVLNFLFSSPTTQLLMNDAGLVVAAFLSGAAVFLTVFPIAKKGNMRYIGAIIERFIRFLPAMASLTALEFLWPLIGSGPFYKRVADFNLRKCERNWWLNLLFLNNYFIDGIDICGGHSFYSSVDMQLFVIALIGIYLFTVSSKSGIAFCFWMIFFGTQKMAYNAIVHSTTGTLYTPNPTAEAISNYFSYVTVHVSTYMPAYFTGFLIAYGHSIRAFPQKVDGWMGHLKWFLAFQTSQQALSFVAALYNSFGVIPHSMSFLVVVLTRSFQTLTMSLWFVYLMTFKSAWEESHKKKEEEEALQKAEVPDESKKNSAEAKVGSGHKSISFLKAICRLSFSVYMSNYLYIRTEFFTRRFLQHNHLFWISHRLVSSMILIYVTAVMFQLFFLSPFDALRVHVMKSLRRQRQPSSAAEPKKIK